MTDTTNTPEQRTEKQIQDELEATRQEMISTVDELYGRVQPTYLVNQAKQSAVNTAAKLKSVAVETASDAKDGDPEALKKVGYVVAGVAVFTALVLFRIMRSRR